MKSTQPMRPSFYTRYAITIFLAVAMLAAAACYGSWKAMQNQSNRAEDWLPAEFQETRDLKWFVKHFSGDDLLMVSWEGGSPDDPRLQRAADLLRQPVEIEGKQVAFFRDVLTVPEVMQQLLEKDSRLSPEAALQKLEGSLVGPLREDGTRAACLVVMITPDGWTHRFAMVDRIYACAEQATGLPNEAIYLAGQTIDGVAIDQASKRSVESLLWVCLLVSVVITYLCFRSVRLMLMVIVAAEINRMLTLAIVYYSGFSLDSVLLVAPSLVAVLSVSTAVHLVNYYGDCLREGETTGAAACAVRHGLTPCIYATATTTVGLLSLLVSFLQPIRKFGAFGAAGLVLGTVITFLLLPALLDRFPPRRWKSAKAENGGMSLVWESLFAAVFKARTLVVLVTIVLLALGAWGVTRIKSTARIHDMLPPHDRVLRDYAWLEEHIGPLIPLEVVLEIRPAAEGEPSTRYPMLDQLRLVKQVEEIAKSVEGVDAVVSAATFAPPLYKQRESTVWRAVFNRQLMKFRPDFIEADMLSESEQQSNLWRISARVRAGAHHDYLKLHQEIKRRVSALIESRGDAPPHVAKIVYSGSVPIVQKSQQQVLEDLYASFGTAFLLIAAAMICLLRSIRCGLVAMIPNVFPALVIFGALGWLGINIEIGSMMTATVAMGIAVDDTLHFLTWFRRGLAQGQTRNEAVLAAYRSCGPAMLQTSLICGLGLLVFAASPFQPISRFAWLMSSMLAAALCGDLIVLPAILTGPLGRVFELPKPSNNAELESRSKRHSDLPGIETPRPEAD